MITTIGATKIFEKKLTTIQIKKYIIILGRNTVNMIKDIYKIPTENVTLMVE